MKVVKLTAENFKRLRAVEIEPDGNTVVIAGRNAQGKTSVLDAIWQALGGGKASKGTSRPVRDGEDWAEVTVDLGGYVVTRTWTADGKTALKVTAPDGAKYSSPQTILDGLIGQLAFDPLAFAGLADKDQRAQLLDLVDLPFDLGELDRRRAAIFDRRTEANREVKRLDAQIDGTPEPPADTPPAEVSVTDLMAELTDARKAQTAQADHDRTLADAHRTLNDARTEMRRLQEALEAQMGVIARAEEALAAVEDAPPGPVPNIEAIEERIASADRINAAVRAAQARGELLTARDQAADEAADLTRQIEQIDCDKADGLAASSMPINGLGLDDTGVTYQGVPFGQASAAERLRVSMAIAMAANPELRVIRITDGSLLDADNMATITGMAADGDYQVWIERVDDTGETGIVIEDGQVMS